jgi:hypothetical protein
MEWWATLFLVLGSNGIMLLGNYLMVRKELKHSSEQLEKQLQAQREVDKHERNWNVRSEPLLRLRGELARMAQISESAIDLATQFTRRMEMGKKPEGMGEMLAKAVEAWDACVWGGELYRTLHMQYDHKLKVEVHGIYLAYQSAYSFLNAVGDSENSEIRNQAIRQAKEVMRENATKVSRVQERINELLEGS